MDRTKGKSGKSDTPKSKPLLPKKEKRLLQALTLFSLSVFLLGSMIPVSEERFPSGNLMGILGGMTQHHYVYWTFSYQLSFTWALPLPHRQDLFSFQEETFS